MRRLRDSHAIVWWAVFPGRLRASTREAIASADNEVFLSVASIWELDLKIAKGKLLLPGGYAERLIADGFAELAITMIHAVRAAQLPMLHHDPFDRMLIAQSLAEGLLLVTS